MDPQLTPWTTRGRALVAPCLGRSKLRSASLVRVLNQGKISWVMGFQGYVKSSSTHDQSKATLVFLIQKRENSKGEVPAPRRLRTHSQPGPFPIAARKRATLLRKPMSLTTPQQSRTKGPSGQDIDEFSWSMCSVGSHLWVLPPRGVRVWAGGRCGCQFGAVEFSIQTLLSKKKIYHTTCDNLQSWVYPPWLALEKTPGPGTVTIPKYWFNETMQHLLKSSSPRGACQGPVWPRYSSESMVANKITLWLDKSEKFWRRSQGNERPRF